MMNPTEYSDIFELQAKSDRKLIIPRIIYHILLFITAVMLSMIFIFPILFFVIYAFSNIDIITNTTFLRYSLSIIFVTELVLLFLANREKKRIGHGGGAYFAKQLKAKRVIKRKNSNIKSRQLLNVVEEMSIAAGVTIPSVYVLDREKGINAMVSGHSMHDACLIITEAALQNLSREELQAVMAHEIGHICSGDMKINIEVSKMKYSFQAVSMFGHSIIKPQAIIFGPSNQFGIMIIGFFLIYVGKIGLFISKIFTTFISRDRELLADTLALKFTRNQGALATTFRTILAHRYGPTIINPNIHRVEHCLFSGSRTVGRSYSNFADHFLSPHPPLVKRLSRLDPSFNIQAFYKAEIKMITAYLQNRKGKEKTLIKMQQVLGIKRKAVIKKKIEPKEDKTSTSPKQDIANMLDTSKIATYLVYLLLNSLNKDPINHYLSSLDKSVPSKTAQDLLKKLNVLNRSEKLDLIELSLTLLKSLNKVARNNFLGNAKEIITRDNIIKNAELTYYLYLKFGLKWAGNADLWDQGKKTINSIEKSVCLILSFLAHKSGKTQEEVKLNFGSGLNKLEIKKQLVRLSDITFTSIENSLEDIATLNPKNKKRLLDSCKLIICSDGKFSIKEKELYTIICTALGIPVTISCSDKD